MVWANVSARRSRERHPPDFLIDAKALPWCLCKTNSGETTSEQRSTKPFVSAGVKDPRGFSNGHRTMEDDAQMCLRCQT
jgi:hypothetical protein